MKNALPKILILLQSMGEILPLLCSDKPIQILVILSRFETFRSKTKLEGFVWSHWSIKVAISHSPIPIDDFWQVGIFHHALSKYLNKSHNFKNSNICDVTLQYSIYSTLTLFIDSKIQVKACENLIQQVSGELF